MRRIVLIAHNLRSCHNVGSLLRTAEGLGVERVYLTGYTPYPSLTKDTRLPHIRAKLTRQIHKTALGAEDLVDWEHRAASGELIADLRRAGFVVCALEQSPSSVALPALAIPDAIAIIVGSEVAGIEPEVLTQADLILEIPMLGQKESFNVVQAAAMALYRCRFG